MEYLFISQTLQSACCMVSLIDFLLDEWLVCSEKSAGCWQAGERITVTRLTWVVKRILYHSQRRRIEPREKIGTDCFFFFPCPVSGCLIDWNSWTWIRSECRGHCICVVSASYSNWRIIEKNHFWVSPLVLSGFIKPFLMEGPKEDVSENINQTYSYR